MGGGSSDEGEGEGEKREALSGPEEGLLQEGRLGRGLDPVSVGGQFGKDVGKLSARSKNGGGASAATEVSVGEPSGLVATGAGASILSGIGGV